MAVRLTANSLSAISGGEVNMKPVVQVLEIKQIVGNSNSQQERYQLIISDSVTTQPAMLATQLNDRVKQGGFRNGSVIQLIEYVCIPIPRNGTKIIQVLNMETIIPDCGVIGNPKPFHGGSDSRSPKFVSQGQSTKSTTFHPTLQPGYQPPPNYKIRGSISKNEAPARIIPISALNPYQGRWAIKARVTAKGDLRRYNNARGDGKVFSFDLLDSEQGEIRVTCFNALVDRFYDSIQIGKVYLISKGTLKSAHKNFNHLNNEWEIFLDPTSTLELCPDQDDASIPNQHFSFKSIAEIENLQNNSILDVIAIVTSVNPSVLILTKNGMETQKRNLNLKDQSNHTIELTLWGDLCNKQGRELQEMFDSGIFPVLAIKAAKVSDFSGKSIGTISATQLFINPHSPEASTLRDWFDNGGNTAASFSISTDVMSGGQTNGVRTMVSHIKDQGLGRGDKPDWITVKASLSYIKTDNFCYTACPLMIGDRQCSKKVVKSPGDARWQCERCNQEFDECDYRYLLQAQVQDHTGLTWVMAFQESAEEILGCSAKELYELKYEQQDEIRFGEIISHSLFSQYLFRLKVKEEKYGEEQKVKITIVKAEKINLSSEGRYLLDLIQKVPL